MSILAILQIINASLVAAQAIPGLTASVVKGIQDAINSIEAAINAHQQAATNLDESLLKPIEPVQ